MPLLLLGLLLGLVLKLLSGCAWPQPAKLPEDDARAIQVFLQVWKESGLRPLPRECFVEATRVLHTQTPLQFQRECPGATVDTAAACISSDSFQRGIVVYAIPKPVLAPGVPAIDTTGGPIIHELCHWVADCALNGRGLDALDPWHRRVELWSFASKDPEVRARSIQGRAQRVLFPHLFEQPPSVAQRILSLFAWLR